MEYGRSQLYLGPKTWVTKVKGTNLKSLIITHSLFPLLRTNKMREWKRGLKLRRYLRVRAQAYKLLQAIHSYISYYLLGVSREYGKIL